MADFTAALDHLLDLEGYPGYVDDPHDRGGETFAGISRVNWRGWPGWTRVDQLKHDRQALAADKQLRQAVAVFYRSNFWHPTLERMAHQELAEWLFQMGVNTGWRQAVKFLQRALCVTDDGIFGRQTEDALRGSDPEAILAQCRSEAERFYRTLVTKDATLERYLKGWINRANA